MISGYVSAYTSTKLGERGVEEKKVANPELFFWQRVTMPRWNMTDGSFCVLFGGIKWYCCLALAEEFEVD